MGRRAAVHLRAVIRGMLFIGFSVQILLGMSWMGMQFSRVQDFEEPASALYRGLRTLTGGWPQAMYLLQLTAGFLAGYYLLEKLRMCGWGASAHSMEKEPHSARGRLAERLWRLWTASALLTFPFAMQCHLALLPCSFLGSLFLLLLAFLIQIFQREKKASAAEKGGEKRAAGRGRRAVWAALAAGCAVMSLLLSGVAGREGTGRSFEALMASRFAWPAIWNDRGSWTEDLRQIAEGVLWETSYAPENMALLEKTIEEQVSPEQAKAYYRQIAETGWRNHGSMVIRQIGWDVLGYGVTPLILRLQLEGEAYDSHTGRNYEIMRGNSPVLTRIYVNYSCWWFVASLILTLLSGILGIVGGAGSRLREWALPLLACLVCSGLLVGILTMRGAGIMDYKFSFAVNQLWLALMLTGGAGYRP